MHSRYFDFPEIPADGVGKRCHLINRLYGVCETICFQKNYQLTQTSYCESRTADRYTPHSEMHGLRERRDLVQIIRIANLKYA